MPYAGPRDGGASIFDSYVQGAGLKLARHRAIQVKKLEDAQLELSRAESAQKMDLATSEDIRRNAYNKRAQGEYDTALEDRQQTLKDEATNRERRTTLFNEGQADYATKQTEKHSLDKATEFTGGMSLDTVGEVFPEMQGDIDNAKKAIDSLRNPDGSELSPHARGLASIGAAKALQDKADMLGQRKALDHLNDWLHTGAGADPSGDNTAAQALQQQLGVALSGGKIKWPAVIKATKDFSIEQSKRSAKMQANQNARVNIGQMFFGEGGMRPMFEPGSDEDLEARSIMEQAGRGLISEPAASKQIFALKHGGDKAGAKQTGPHDSDVITLAKELHDRGEAKTLQEGIAMARKTLGPQADEQPPTGKEAQIKAAADAFEKKNGRKPTVSELKAVVEGGQPSEAAVAPVPEPPPSKPIGPDIGRSMNSPRNPADAGLQARRDAQYADTHESRMTGSGHKDVEVPSKMASAAKADEGASFARSADPYLRTLTSDELAEFRRLRREGTADERAAWLAKMKAKS